MTAQRLPHILLGLGLATLAAAVAWWAWFYSWLAGQLGGSLSEATQCLVINTDACAMLAGVGAMAGQAAYTPIAFWAGIALLLAGGFAWSRAGKG